MRVRVPGGGRWLFAAALLGLVVTLAAVGTGRAPAPPAVAPRVAGPVQAPRSGRPPPWAPPIPRASVTCSASPTRRCRPLARSLVAARAEGERAPAPPPAGPRLVGLVRRAGRLMAALSVDGEVELAGPGDSAAGVTVLSVGEEGVRVRCADGSEQTLALP